jgi:hypothetical protein
MPMTNILSTILFLPISEKNKQNELSHDKKDV